MEQKKTIGGQAVIEGVMLRDASTGNVAVANRLSTGEIHVEKTKFVSISKKYKILKWPLLRGVASFIESMIVGIKTLMDSAEIVGGEIAEEYEPTKFQKFLSEKLHMKLENVIAGVSLILGLGLAVLLFTILPTAITSLLKNFVKSSFLLSLIEGVVKIAIFVAYILLVSLMNDIKRVYQYHGAEHKTINCYESGMEVNVENIQKSSRLHPRCGTSFMFFVLFISILCSVFISWNNVVLRVLLKILLMPAVAGIAYEIIRLSGKCKSKLIYILIWPGMLMQKLTTKEPDAQQIEVAIASFKAVTGEDTEENNEVVQEDLKDAKS